MAEDQIEVKPEKLSQDTIQFGTVFIEQGQTQEKRMVVTDIGQAAETGGSFFAGKIGVDDKGEESMYATGTIYDEDVREVIDKYSLDRVIKAMKNGWGDRLSEEMISMLKENA